MPRRASAKRYARAVFELALQGDQLDRWADDLRLINETLQSQELRTFLEHAKMPMSRKADTIGQVFSDVDTGVRNLLSLLVSRGLVELFFEVDKEYRRLVDEFRGREQVEVLSAVPLDEPETQRIAGFVTDLVRKEVVVDSRVDPSILGGLVLKVGDKLIDGSTRTRLEELGKRLQRDSARVGG